ncbi:hypothetical protein H5410_010701 [Solanum commersonii]|uniref:Uncharacterized protein n=1 Tax=Solanum commersonii TaxID=4109 RepID=A0A9J6AMI6_SOLCO|nr:hypothetical protein H5410_010701 [Solanum commersonii]
MKLLTNVWVDTDRVSLCQNIWTIGILPERYSWTLLGQHRKIYTILGLCSHIFKPVHPSALLRGSTTRARGEAPENDEALRNWWSASFNSQYLKECWINFQGAPRPGVSKEKNCSGRWCKCWPH